MSPESRPRPEVPSRGARVLLALRGVPTWLLFLLVLGATVGGLLAHGMLSAVLLGILALLLAWLASMSWPVVPPVGRAVRVLSAAVAAGLALYRAVSGK
jgi:hypothetical protein